MKILMSIIRIILIFTPFLITRIFSQTPDDLKRFMETYEKIKVDQEINEVVKKGIDSDEDNLQNNPVKLIVSPIEITKYYNEKLNAIKKDLIKLDELLEISDSTHNIKNFGYNYFSKRDSIRYIDNLKITNDYILDYGDEIIITVWGQVEQYEKKIIQRDGSVFIENVGLLNLGGKNITQAKKYIFNQFSKVYSTLSSNSNLSFLDVTVGRLKNINIVCSGNVKYPGNYVVNPTVNLTNLLIMCGGITENGSLRNIFISRNSTIIDTIDLYPLISGQGSLSEFYFKNNDVVLVPAKGSSVALTGSVSLPAYYEIINDNIENIINFAGGLKRNTNDIFFLYRSNSDNAIINKSESNKFFLQDGDSLIVPPKHVSYQYVTVSNEDRIPFNIPWTKKLSYSDIISSSNVKIENIQGIELVREIGKNKFEKYLLQNFDGGNFEFLPKDFINIKLINQQKKISTVFIKGSVKSPGLYPILPGVETLSSLIEKSGGLHSNTSIYNVKVKRDTLYFGSQFGDIVLSAGDTIIANSYNETVKLEGEFNYPNLVEWTDKRSAKDYLKLGGGISSYGDTKNIVYVAPYGEAIKIKKNSNLSILPGSKIIVYRKPDKELSSNPDRLQQLNSIITSLVTIAILANTTSSN